MEDLNIAQALHACSLRLPLKPHLGAIACSVHRDGLGKVGGGVLQRLTGVGRHQLTQLARLAEGQGA